MYVYYPNLTPGGNVSFFSVSHKTFYILFCGVLLYLRGA